MAIGWFSFAHKIWPFAAKNGPFGHSTANSREEISVQWMAHHDRPKMNNFVSHRNTQRSRHSAEPTINWETLSSLLFHWLRVNCVLEMRDLAMKLGQLILGNSLSYCPAEIHKVILDLRGTCYHMTMPNIFYLVLEIEWCKNEAKRRNTESLFSVNTVLSFDKQYSQLLAV